MMNIRNISKYRERYIHICEEDQSVCVIDTLVGNKTTEGGLYLWHFDDDDYTFDFDLNHENTLKIIGVDIV